MNSHEIALHRLTGQMLAGSAVRSPGEVVAEMGAMQAQDYLSSLWAVGARMAGTTESAVEKAIANRKIVRTWSLRGTLQLVAPGDLHWLIEHLGPRLIPAAARRHRDLELDDAVFSKSKKIFVRALKGGRGLTRTAMMDLLERAKIVTTNQRGYHILWRLALEGLLCFGPREGKQHTFVLLDEWVARPKRHSREEALADFSRRYFTSHGPATIEDFSWWIGLKKSDAIAAVNSIKPLLSSFKTNTSTYWLSPSESPLRERKADYHLLPSFDEFLVGYTNRSDVAAANHLTKVFPGANGMFMPVMIKSGRAAGIWKRELTGKGLVSLAFEPFAPFSKTDLRGWTAAAKRYAEFLEAKPRFA